MRPSVAETWLLELGLSRERRGNAGYDYDDNDDEYDHDVDADGNDDDNNAYQEDIEKGEEVEVCAHMLDPQRRPRRASEHIELRPRRVYKILQQGEQSSEVQGNAEAKQSSKFREMQKFRGKWKVKVDVLWARLYQPASPHRQPAWSLVVGDEWQCGLPLIHSGLALTLAMLYHWRIRGALIAGIML